jgi:hypothetical protein
MKKAAFLFLCFVCVVSGFSQKTPAVKDSTGQQEMKTLFCNMDHYAPAGYFISISNTSTTFGDKYADLVGISAGFIFNHHWSVGGTYNGIANSGHLNYMIPSGDTLNTELKVNLRGGYGGLVVEYILWPMKRVHLSFPLLIGGGMLEYTRQHSDSTHNDSDDHHHYDHRYDRVAHDTYFVVEPGVKAEANLLKFMRLGIGVSYRYTPDLKLVNTSKTLINQFNLNVSLKFGKF